MMGMASLRNGGAVCEAIPGLSNRYLLKHANKKKKRVLLVNEIMISISHGGLVQ